MKTTNEDRHITSIEHFPGPVFGVFDGHGGTFSADFLTRQLVKTVGSAIHRNIGDQALNEFCSSQELSQQERERKCAIEKQFESLNQQLLKSNTMRIGEKTEPGGVADTADELQMLEDQLAVAIGEMQREVKQIDVEEIARRVERRHWCDKQHNHFLKAFSEGFHLVDTQLMQKNPSQDGSTALLIWFIAGDIKAGTEDDDSQSAAELKFYAVNVGDCRAVMCRGGRGVLLTSDHKPDRPDERQRIEKAGGFVGKLAGISRVYSAAGAGLTLQQESSKYLAVSRAFGDRALKIPTPLVSCEPDVKRYHVEDDDLFLVLGCDGIWDVLTEQEVVDIALPHFHDVKAAADAIVKAAYRKGSADNLTATVVQFGWKSKPQVQQPSVKSTTDTLVNSGEEEEEIDIFSI